MRTTCTPTCTVGSNTKRANTMKVLTRFKLRGYRNQWRRRESNPRPPLNPEEPLRA
jgi:hypothetical protein